MIPALRPVAGFRRGRTAACGIAAVLLLVTGCRREAATSGLPAPARPGLSEVLRTAIERAEAAGRETPDSAEAWTALANVYQANGFAEPAVAGYRRAIQHSGDGDGKLHHLLALALVDANRPEEAEQALARATDRSPDYVPAWLRRAELRYKSGDPAAALQLYRAVLERDPDCPEALLALAREAIRRGDDPAALPLLDRLMKLHPEYGSALSLKAQVLERRGRSAEAAALRAQGRTRKDPPIADPVAEQMMLACVDVNRLGIRFEDALNAGRIDQALANLDRIEAIDPDNWLPHRMRGFAFAHTGRLGQAVTEYRRAIELGGDPALSYGGLVSALMKLDRSAEAEQAAREGLDRAPRTSSLMLALAEIHRARGERSDAVALLERALAVDDRDAAALRALGHLRWEAGERETALTHFARAVDADRLDAPTRMFLAQHHLESGRPELAVPLLEEAAALLPERADVREMLALAHVRIGNRHAREGELEPALANYEDAVRVNPSGVEAHTNRIRLLAHAGRFADAERSVEAWLRVDPQEPSAWLLRGDVQRAAGHPAQARESWRRAAELVPHRPANPALTQAIQARLDALP